ncbi:MAG: carboxypeptidase regulatory-like domain-containing protein [Candidatus Kapaibacterium sp.]
MKKLLFLFVPLFLLAVFVITGQTQIVPPDSVKAVVIVQPNSNPYVKVSWVHPVLSMRFNVYRKFGAISDTGVFVKKFSNVNGKFVNDFNVQMNKTYSYFVKAVVNNVQSISSDTVQVTLIPPPPPVKAVVTGFVYNDSTNLPVKGAMVKFFSTTVTPHSCIVFNTDSLGKFKALLNVGQYYAYIAKQGFRFEYYNNKPNIQTADIIVLAVNDTININVGLAPLTPPVLYNITGSVKDSVNNPVRSRVHAYKVRGNNIHFYSYGAITDSLGNYTLHVRGGDSIVVFVRPLYFDYLPEYWDNKRILLEADKIFVTGNISNINFVLEHVYVFPNGISGQVKDTANTVGIMSKVMAFRYGHNAPSISNLHRNCNVLSDSLGNYVINNMIPGKYKLFAKPFGDYRPSYFRYDHFPTLNWLMADSVIVDSTGIVSNIDFRVVPLPDTGLAVISGTVKTNTGINIIGAVVYVVDENNDIVNYAVSDQNGVYRVEGLMPGNYTVKSDKIYYMNQSSHSVVLDYNTNMFKSLAFVMTIDNVTGIGSDPETPSTFALSQNYPNPFNPSTTISFSVSELRNVSLKIYDILGQEVSTLVSENLAPGSYSVTFNASSLPSGMYFYKLQAGDFTSVKKMTLIK